MAMDIIRAKEIVQTLANGVDPMTGEVLPQESVYNSPDVIRALFVVLDALKNHTDESLRNVGKPWTEVEDDKLRDEVAAKIAISDIAIEHGRTRGAIQSRMEKLGLKKKPFWLFRRRK